MCLLASSGLVCFTFLSPYYWTRTRSNSGVLSVLNLLVYSSRELWGLESQYSALEDLHLCPQRTEVPEKYHSEECASKDLPWTFLTNKVNNVTVVPTIAFGTKPLWDVARSVVRAFNAFSFWAHGMGDWYMLRVQLHEGLVAVALIFSFIH